MMLPPRILLVILVFASGALCSCGSTPSEKSAGPTESRQLAERPVEEPTEPTWVVVHRNSRLFLQPDENAPFVQYRDVEEQASWEDRLAEERARRAEKEAEADKTRREREKKRRSRLRKRWKKYKWKKRKRAMEREAERVQKKREQRAARKLRAMDKLAQARPYESPEYAFIAFRKVGERDGWVIVETLEAQSDPAHCLQGSLGELERLRLRFYVRADDLAPVVSRRVRVPVYRGSEVILLPGVPLERTGRAHEYRAYVDGFILRLEIHEDSVGKTYRPIRPFEAPITDTVFTDIALAEQKLKLGRRQVLPYNPYRDLHVTGTLWVDRRFFATTQTRCGEYTVHASEDDLAPVGRRGATRLGEGEVAKPPYVKAGATVFSPDGETIGQVTRDYSLDARVDAAGDKVCYRQGIWGKASEKTPQKRTLTLCFEASAVVE